MKYYGACPECGCEISFDFVQPGDETDCPQCERVLDIIDVIENRVYMDPRM